MFAAELHVFAVMSRTLVALVTTPVLEFTPPKT
jgi:hypothetical protein